MRSETRSADGVKVVYETTGRGDAAVMLVHGWCMDRSCWRYQIPVLAERWQVVSLDLAGHGESDGDRAEWTMPAFGADVAAVAEALALQSIVLVGHSMGGDVAVDAALALPDQVAGVLMLDTYHTLEDHVSDALDGYLEAFRQNHPASVALLIQSVSATGSDPALVADITDAMSRTDPGRAAEFLRASFSNPPRIVRALSHLSIPVKAINGTGRVSHLDRLMAYGLDTQIMAGVGHFLMLEAPEAFNELLVEHIEDLLRPQAPTSNP